MPQAMIRLEEVSKTFPAQGERAEVLALRSLTLEVARGEMLCLIGPSGCGKTTTLRLLNRLATPDSGRVLIDGRDIAQGDPVRLRRRMGTVVQRGGLFPHMTIARNIGLLCELEGWPAARVRARVDETLELVQLAPAQYRARYPRQLSGGERQRVGVARALALDPEVLLLDEPFGALDPITRDELQQQFLELRGRVDKTIVLVSHDLDEAFRLADRVGLMEAGRLVQLGTLSDFRDAPTSDFVRRFLERHLHAS